MVLLCLASCGEIRVKHLYRREKESAQAQIGTPCLSHFPEGEELLISWKVGEEKWVKGKMHLLLELAYRDFSHKTEIIPLERKWGNYLYSLLGEDFQKSGGIYTYRISLLAEDREISRWEHQVWAKWILPEEIGAEVKKRAQL